jgi:lipopolysaccharide export system permease protein
MAGVCLYVNDSLSPRSHEACRRIIATLGVDTPMEALDEGRFEDDFPEMSIYVGKKKDGRVYNVRIYDMRRSRMKREITAKSGVLRAAENGRDLVVDLFDVRIDPFSEDVRGPGYLGRSTVTVYDALRQRAYRRTEKDMAIWELVDGIAGSPERSPWMTSQDVARKRMRYAVEMSKRLCLAASCVTFALLGIPLGVRAHRRESSAGVAISLLLVFNFYLFVIVAEALSGRPETRPDLIVWLPVLLSILLGMLLVRKTNHG